MKQPARHFAAFGPPLAAWIVMSVAGVAQGADPIAGISHADPPSHGLAIIDWALILGYLVLTLGIGWYYGRRQESIREYFVGDGRMNPLLVGVSLFATLLSTISYLSMPGEALGKGPAHMASLLAYPLVFPIVGYLMLPVYMRQRVTSAYELLEQRLGLGLRLLGASMFLALRLVWMSLMIYLTSNALAQMMGLGPRWVPWIAAVSGLVTIAYTSAGGLRAVVVTDLMQSILLYGGALLVLGVVTWRLGGVSWFPTHWQDHWDTQPWFTLNPQTRASVFGSLVSVLIWFTCTLGGDQTTVQRFMATQDAAAARRALAMQLAVAAIVGVTLGLVGFALMGYFGAKPEMLPDGATLSSSADKLFPRFIVYHLPAGISGLVVAGMLAAAMSSLDSGVNSITAVVMTDFLERFGRAPATERGRVLFAKSLAFGIGVFVVSLSLVMKYIPGNITEVTNKTVNLLTTPIFCLFFFALFVPFATRTGVWAGAILGTLAAIICAFSGPLALAAADAWGMAPESFGALVEWQPDAATGELRRKLVRDPISFQWISVCGLTVDVVVGTVVSLLFPGRRIGATSPHDAGGASPAGRDVNADQ